MTACVIEDESTGPNRAAGTADPGPGEPEAAEDPDGAPDEAGSRDGAPGGGAAGAPATPPEGSEEAPEGAGSLDDVGAPAFTISADGAYAARLTRPRPASPGEGPDAADQTWYPERWTLDGPEPYAVPLPLNQPEEPDSQVLPLADGRVLIRRRVAGHHAFSLLYPTGPGTGELPVGAVACADPAAAPVLLPPAPDGVRAYALAADGNATAVWLVAGGAFGPELVARVPGRCEGGVWLDREGRLLALNRRLPGRPVKAVAVDLGRGGEVTPLLQIAPESNDRLLLADPDSGLLLIRSDAPGRDRLGWGVLGSCLPVRFPECLGPADVAVTPFAVQPGQMLMPEDCAVALRIDGPAGSWVGLWRPSGRRLHQYAAPEGWIAGSGVWTRDGVLRLPYATDEVPCGVALLEAPCAMDDEAAPAPAAVLDDAAETVPDDVAESGTQPSGAEVLPIPCRPVPLGQAPLTGRTVPG